MIETLEADIAPIEREVRRFVRNHPGCRANVKARFGIGELIARAIVAELPLWASKYGTLPFMAAKARIGALSTGQPRRFEHRGLSKVGTP